MKAYTGDYKWAWIKYNFEEYEPKVRIRKQDLLPVSRLGTIDQLKHIDKRFGLWYNSFKGEYHE